MADRARSTSSTYPQRTQPEDAEANEHTCTILPPCNTVFEHLTRLCDTTFRRSSRAQSEPRQERRQEPVRLKPTQTQTPLRVIAQIIYLGLSQAYWVALLARRRPCARYCILLRALVTATAARGLSGPFCAALTLCFGTQAWPHFLGRRWHPFLRALRLGLRSSRVLAQRVRRPHRR